MKAVLLTREYPPEVYGGAGVHVEYLARELDRLIDVEVRCFGAPRAEARPSVVAFEPWAEVGGSGPYAGALKAMSVNLAMASGLEGASLVHAHTWYAGFAGRLGKLIHRLPLIVTTHSLEPLRPWKAEQLGTGGYALSSFCERVALEQADAIIAVSREMKRDLLGCYEGIDPERVVVIYNGIDPLEYRPGASADALDRYGVDRNRPYVLFVGRITRQKGISYLLDAALEFEPGVQLVLLAGAPDTHEIAAEVSRKADELRARRGDLVWVREMVPKRDVVQLLAHALVFCCPSVYEPLGIVNLEAMACETAVVATATGGIPEVVADGETGHLVPFDPGDPVTREPRDGRAFAGEIAARVNRLVADPEAAAGLGRAGRRRVLEHFDWRRIAEETVDLYRRVLTA